MEQVTDLHVIKQTIWRLCKKSLINLHVAADKAKVKIPYDGLKSVGDAQAILAVLTKPRRITPPVPQWVKDRYNDAHRIWFSKEYPEAHAGGHYTLPVFPKVGTSNGLTTFITNFLSWTGFYGNRINTTGRKLPNGKWITGTTKKGTGDILACIKSVMYFFEVKVGNDMPSDKQLAQQRKVRASGGEYYFVKTAEMFLNIFDSIVYG